MHLSEFAWKELHERHPLSQTFFSKPRIKISSLIFISEDLNTWMWQLSERHFGTASLPLSQPNTTLIEVYLGNVISWAYSGRPLWKVGHWSREGMPFFHMVRWVNNLANKVHNTRTSTLAGRLAARHGMILCYSVLVHTKKENQMGRGRREREEERAPERGGVGIGSHPCLRLFAHWVELCFIWNEAQPVFFFYFCTPCADFT